jgi:8-amino-7-oxononanoate synthase
MNDPLAWIDGESAAWAARGLTRRLVPHGGGPAGRLTRDGRPLVTFGSNDYLGLAADPRLACAAAEAAGALGWGAGASPLVAGWTDAHHALADDLAAFERAEAAVVFPTGYAANLGTIPALVGSGDAIYSDALNHACLIDGCRLSRATVRVYRHADATHLAELLESDRGRFRRSLIVTDGVFSMDGALAPLAELADLADRHGAMLMVDEAHGTGVFGRDGRGAASACGVADRVAVRVGTLSKALGSLGGFVAGSARLVDWLVNHARPLIFSTALPPAAAAAAREALAIVQAEPWRRDRVHALADRLRTGLTAAGLSVRPSPGPIVPVVLGEPGRAVETAARLREAGFDAPAIRPPTVPEGTSRLRICLSAAHTEQDVDDLIRALTDGPGGGPAVG